MKGRLSIEDLGKAYRFYPSRWARLAEWTTPRQQRHELHWVLRHVSLEVAPGESVGIIGRNGAGKSTLLKLVTGTTQPTEGAVKTSGRVAALLELGMGFHSEFTGRENALMTGQLAGLTAAEIEAAMPEIERFAEIGRYIDEPLRTYSSGMVMRLAFSVASSMDPEVLLIDEVLAVGDQAFQARCLDRIHELRKHGRTLAIVSHGAALLEKFCDQAVWLDHGELIMTGTVHETLESYSGRR
jgi:homopolymeric O-antigen transport system ATP-binding protein